MDHTCGITVPGQMSLDGPLRACCDSTLQRVILSEDSGHWEEGGLLRSSALWGSELFDVLHFFRVQDPPRCGVLDTDQSQATERGSELLERPSSCPGECQSTLSFSQPGDL